MLSVDVAMRGRLNQVTRDVHVEAMVGIESCISFDQ
jgi:hypothetical protein